MKTRIVLACSLFLGGVVVGGGASAYFLRAPATYDDCILKYLHAGMSYAVGGAVVQSCRAKHPRQAMQQAKATNPFDQFDKK